MNLIDATGQPIYGVIPTPVELINFQDCDLHSPMDKTVSRLSKQMRFNQFQFIGLMTDELIVGAAIVNLKWVSNAFVYIYDRLTGEMEEVSYLHPIALSTTMSLQPDSGAAKFSHPGVSISIESGVDVALGLSQRKLKVGIKSKLEIDVVIQEPKAFAPLRVCSRAGYDGWVFTQKAAGLNASGEIRLKDKIYKLDSGNASGSYDWSCGFMRRETSWNWACFSGFLADGRRIGLNLAAGVNETGVTENAIWIDGELVKLDMAMFEFDRYQPEKSWHVSTSDGRLDLHFEPEGKREEKINALLIASNFKQMFGLFNGIYVDDSGEKILISNVPGFMEDHYAKW